MNKMMNFLRRVIAWLVPARVQVVVSVELTDLATLAGGMEEAYVLKRVMDWCASNDRRDSKRHRREGQYWMYYSYREWVEKETGWMTQNQVRRVITNLEERGLLIGKVFSDGGSKWYRPNLEMIRGAGMPEKGKIIKFDPSRKAQTPFTIPQTPCENPQTPLRDSTNINDSNQSFNPPVLTNQSTNQGISADNDDSKNKSLKGIDSLKSQYGTDAVEQALAKAEQYNAKNPVGYARSILQNDKKLSGNPLYRSMKNNPAPQPSVISEQIPTPNPSPLRREGNSPAKSPEQVTWAAVLDQVELHLNKSNYETWVRDCEVVRVDGRVWTVRAASKMARDMCQYRLHKIIKEMAGRVVGADVQLNFVVSGEAVAS